jgi:O-antigen/teichoic acid export membrane protein
MLPDNDDDAKALVLLSIIITILTSFLSFILFVIFRKSLIKITDNIEIFLWLVPIGILISGILQIYVSWGTRKEQYRYVANSRIAQSGVTVIGQLSLGLSSRSSLGLIYGTIMGMLSSLIYLFYKTSKKYYIRLAEISKRRVIYNLNEYKKFPKYQSTSVLINSLSQHLPIILLILFYSPIIAGFYSLTHRALTTPARLIGNSVRQVYYQRASKMFIEDRSISRILTESTIGLIKISIIPFIIIGVFAQPIFSFVFGNDWIVSGKYAQIIVLYIFMLTINPPSVMTIQILGMQRFSMIYEFVLALFRFFAIYLGYILYNNHYASIGMFALVGVLFNICLIVFIFRKVKKIESLV